MSVDDGTKGQSISEGRSHVCNVHIIVTFALVPAPVLQSFQRAHGPDSIPKSTPISRNWSWNTHEDPGVHDFHVSLSSTVGSRCLKTQRSHSIKVKLSGMSKDQERFDRTAFEPQKSTRTNGIKLQLQLHTWLSVFQKETSMVIRLARSTLNK